MDQEIGNTSTKMALNTSKYLYAVIILLVLCVAWLFFDVFKLKKSYEIFSVVVTDTLDLLDADIVDVRRLSNNNSANINGIYSDLSYVTALAENANMYAHSHNTYSDQRLKLGVEPLPYSVEDILQLRAVTFFWDKENPMLSDMPYGRQIGMIAHEVEYVIPELVYTDNSGYKHMDYVSLTPILVEVIKEQQSQLDAMQLQIEELSNQLDSLYSQNEQ